MNTVILMGRLTKDPETRYTNGAEPMAVTRYTLAADRIGKDAGADFIQCVAFGKAAEFAEKYFTKGMKVAITGRIQTGAYKRQDGSMAYSTNIAVSTQEFCESKRQTQQQAAPDPAPPTDADGFFNASDDTGLPWV